MEFWSILISFAVAYFIQLVFTLIQMKNFNMNFKKLRSLGRVSIGKKKGGFLAGSISMFAINDNGIILGGVCMSGVTVLARFKEINQLNGMNISSICEDDLKYYTCSVRKSIIDAANNYNKITNGHEFEEVKVPFKKLKCLFNR